MSRCSAMKESRDPELDSVAGILVVVCCISLISAAVGVMSSCASTTESHPGVLLEGATVMCAAIKVSHLSCPSVLLSRSHSHVCCYQGVTSVMP